jgi:diguanylate cyclase (GGDEF)-like protein
LQNGDGGHAIAAQIGYQVAMRSAALPADETARIVALHRTGLLDTPDEHVFDCITSVSARLFDMPIVLFSLVDTDRQWFKSCVGLAERETSREVSFCAHVVASGEMIIVADARLDPRFADNPAVTGSPGVRFYAGHPIREPGGALLGTLCLVDTKPRMLTAEQRQLFQDLAYLAERAVLGRRVGQAQSALVTKLYAARRESLIDPMLRIWNRAGVATLLLEQAQILERSPMPYSIVMLDVDHFKRINDTHGHPVGDRVLQEIARAARAELRSGDELGRYGGEEFIVLLPETTIGDAIRMAERLRRAVEVHELPLAGAALRCTTSAGVATRPASSSEALDALVKRADDALLEAKRTGRNRVVASQGAAS